MTDLISRLRFVWCGAVCAFAIADGAIADVPEALYLQQADSSRRFVLQAKTPLAETARSELLDRATEIVFRNVDKQWNFATTEEIRAVGALEIPAGADGATLTALVIREDAEVSVAELRTRVEKIAAANVSDEFFDGAADENQVRRVIALKRIGQIDNVEQNAAVGALATAKIGQPVEIRLLADPTGLGVGADLPLRLYVDGSAYPQSRFTAEHVASGTSVNEKTDPKAIGHFRLTEAGEWRVTFHVLQNSDDAETPRQWLTATITFIVPDREVK